MARGCLPEEDPPDCGSPEVDPRLKLSKFRFGGRVAPRCGALGRCFGDSVVNTMLDHDAEKEEGDHTGVNLVLFFRSEIAKFLSRIRRHFNSSSERTNILYSATQTSNNKNLFFHSNEVSRTVCVVRY